MRVQFDVTHPAHVHLFKNAIRTLAAKGHTVAVTSRNKEVTTDLLDAYGIEHTVLSTKGTTTAALISEWTLREFRTARFARRFDPDVIVSRALPSAVHAAALTGAASIVFTDTEYAWKVSKLIAPFVDYWCTPEHYTHDYGDKHRFHDGFDELAYLHPNWFTPDSDRLRQYGVDPDEPYFVLRFVSMGAHHDVSRDGFSPAAKQRLVEALSDHGTVYISSERPLPPELAEYEAPVPPEEIHQLLAFAELLVGDSETMATEAALLGTPTIRANSHATDGVLGVFVQLEERGLVESVDDIEVAHDRAIELATSPDASETWTRRRDELLEETVDVTDYMLDVIDEAAHE
jgi:predicted glycosyltransferase